jgi:hypothetical protein
MFVGTCVSSPLYFRSFRVLFQSRNRPWKIEGSSRKVMGWICSQNYLTSHEWPERRWILVYLNSFFAPSASKSILERPNCTFSKGSLVRSTDFRSQEWPFPPQIVSAPPNLPTPQYCWYRRLWRFPPQIQAHSSLTHDFGNGGRCPCPFLQGDSFLRWTTMVFLQSAFPV